MVVVVQGSQQKENEGRNPSSSNMCRWCRASIRSHFLVTNKLICMAGEKRCCGQNPAFTGQSNSPASRGGTSLKMGQLKPVQSHSTAVQMPASPCKETGYLPCHLHVPELACRSQILPWGAAGLGLAEEPVLWHSKAWHGMLAETACAEVFRLHITKHLPCSAWGPPVYARSPRWGGIGRWKTKRNSVNG